MISILKKVRKILFPFWGDLYQVELDKLISENKNILVIGCGFNTKIRSATHLDINPVVKPDIVWDLNVTPYPISDNTYDCVIAINILEHINEFNHIMGEIHRISKNNSNIFILVPHFSNSAAYIDTTHKINFSISSCDYFIKGTEIEKQYGYYMNYRYGLIKHIISLTDFWNYFLPINYLVQKYPSIWEHYLCYIVRGSGIFWWLRVEK